MTVTTNSTSYYPVEDLEDDDVDLVLISFHRDQLDECIQIYYCQLIPPF